MGVKNVERGLGLHWSCVCKVEDIKKVQIIHWLEVIVVYDTRKLLWCLGKQIKHSSACSQWLLTCVMLKMLLYEKALYQRNLKAKGHLKISLWFSLSFNSNGICNKCVTVARNRVNGAWPSWNYKPELRTIIMPSFACSVRRERWRQMIDRLWNVYLGYCLPLLSYIQFYFESTWNE